MRDDFLGNSPPRFNQFLRAAADVTIQIIERRLGDLSRVMLLDWPTVARAKSGRRLEHREMESGSWTNRDFLADQADGRGNGRRRLSAAALCGGLSLFDNSSATQVQSILGPQFRTNADGSQVPVGATAFIEQLGQRRINIDPGLAAVTGGNAKTSGELDSIKSQVEALKQQRANFEEEILKILRTVVETSRASNQRTEAIKNQAEQAMAEVKEAVNTEAKVNGDFRRGFGIGGYIRHFRP